MDRPMNIIKPSEMTKLLYKLNNIGFLFGIKDFWTTDITISSRFIYIYHKVDYVINIINVFFAMSVIGSSFTQKNLTDTQAMEGLMFSIAISGNMLMYYILLYYKQENRNLLYYLAVVLKERQNDTDLEREMIKKIKVFSMSLYGVAYTVIVLYGFRGLHGVITAGENFITLTPAWPDVRDNSTAAGVFRVFFYFWWFPCIARILVTLLMMLTIMLAICYQFKNLQIYFYSLDDIFSDETLTQTEKEVKYEQGFKAGIQMHSLTLWCKNQHQHFSKAMFAIEVILVFSMLLTQLATLLVGERSLPQLCTMFLMMTSTCLSLGFFMWNGGDITIEASKLSEAMYSSGWQNCYGKSAVRIRKLVVNAMRQAQYPVVYKTLGVVEFSYESYVTLVKMPYTVVSVLY